MNDQVLADEVVALAAAMGHRQYSGLGQQDRKQVDSFTGANYLAITTIARIAARCEPAIYDDRINTITKSILRQRRSEIFTQSKSWSEYGNDMQQAEPKFRWWKLINQPNPWQTGSHFRWDCIQQLRIHGMCIVWNVRNGVGKTVWRIVLPKSLLTPIPPNFRADMQYGGVRVSTLQSIGAYYGMMASVQPNNQFIANREIGLSDLSMYSYPHPYLRGDGYSPSSAGEAWIDILSASAKAQKEQLDFGPRQKVLLNPPSGEASTTGELDSIQRRFDNRVANSKSGIIFTPHGSATPITLDADEMGYATTHDTLFPAVMGLHGVSKAAAGMSENMTYGSNAVSMAQTIMLAVQPDLDLMADADTSVMVAEEGPAFWVEYPVPPMDDAELENQQSQTDLTAGCITVKEYRKRRGLPPLGDERDEMMAGSEEIKNWKPKRVPLSVPPIKTATSQAKSLLHVETVIDEQKPPAVIAFDLDGTLAEYEVGVYIDDKIGAPKQGMVEIVRNCKAAGLGVVVYTCRDNDAMVSAWLKEHAIPWDAINMNPWAPSTGAKMMADVYVDDKAVSAFGNEAIVMAGLIDAMPNHEVRERLTQATDKMRFNRKQGFLFIPVQGELLNLVKSLQKTIDPDDLGPSGLEVEPHITVLHGVLSQYPIDVLHSIEGAAKAMFTVKQELQLLGDHTEGEVAVVLSLEGDGLQQLHSLCKAALPHAASKWLTYHPHITLGYVRPERADRYLIDTGIGNQSAIASQIVFRHPSEADTVIPLK